MQNLISLMLALPLVGAILQSVLGSRGEQTKYMGTNARTLDPRGSDYARWIAIASSSASAICGAVLMSAMKPGVSAPQLAESHPWVGSYAISYQLALDGLNTPVVLLVSIVFPLLIAAEWDRKQGRKGIHGLLLLLQTALLGAVCAQDLFLLFFFWSMSAFPFYFLIGIWGGNERESAAFRSFVTASLGNALFFGALLLVYYSNEPHSFSLSEISKAGLNEVGFDILGKRVPTSDLAFSLAAVGLMLRTPIWPFHGWFTRVSVQAPAAVLVAMMIVAIPVATSIFIRLSMVLFSETFSAATPWVVGVGVVNLVIGGLCAVSQRALRPLLAYVAMGELGVLLMGVGSSSSAGMVGAVYQQLVLGLAFAGMGLLIGVIVERTRVETFDRTGQNDPASLGGVAQTAPIAALVAAVATASILGIPGLGGFVSHSLLMIGGYAVHPSAVLAAAGALLLSSYTLLRMYRNVFLGQATAATATFADLLPRERLLLLPLVIALVFFGLYPKPMVDLIRPTILEMLRAVN
jgi:NADH-quinone oxidoreductase subunit M